MNIYKKKKIAPPPGGLEPPTFRLTAERASHLRHGGLRIQLIIITSNQYLSDKNTAWVCLFLLASAVNKHKHTRNISRDTTSHTQRCKSLSCIKPNKLHKSRNMRWGGLCAVFRNLVIFLRWGVVSTSPNPPKLEGHPLSAVHNCLFKSICSYPPYSETVPPSATWGRAMPGWQGPTYRGGMGWEGRKIYTASWWVDLKEKDCLGGLDLDCKIILK